MSEEELIALKSEVKSAGFELQRAITNAQCALENMEEFHADDTEPRQAFDWLIEHGFVPGAKFKLATDKVYDIKVKSYSHVGGKYGGAAVIVGYDDEKESTLVIDNVKRHIDKFTEVQDEQE